MPIWTHVDLGYRPYGAGSEPFVRSRGGFAAATLGKVGSAPDSARQAHFEGEVVRVAEALATSAVPVFVSFRGDLRRMDKGCVGHAVARGFLAAPTDGPDGIVEAVVVRQPAQGSSAHE